MQQGLSDEERLQKLLAANSPEERNKWALLPGSRGFAGNDSPEGRYERMTLTGLKRLRALGEENASLKRIAASQIIGEGWGKEYSSYLLHSGVGYLTPSGFAQQHHGGNEVEGERTTHEYAGSVSL